MVASRDSHTPEICSTLPRWHSGVALIAALIGSAVFLWSIVVEEFVGAAIGLILCVAFLYAFFNGLTTRLWISVAHLSMRDRILRVRRFGFQEIESITFVPDELFEVNLSSGQRIGFPAGSKNLPQLSKALAAAVSQVRQVKLGGVLVDLK